MSESEYAKALYIACDLLNGSYIYGIDSENLFEYLMKKEGVVTTNTYYDFILHNIDRFSDVESIREDAIKRLGF